MHASINTNFIVFGLIRLGLEPTIYRTRGKHANHYATDAVNKHLMKRDTQNVNVKHNLFLPFEYHI